MPLPNSMASAAAKNSLIRLTDESTLFTGTDKMLGKLKEQFARRHFVRLPRFLDQPLMQYVQDRIGEPGRFYNKRHKGLALELCMRENAAVRLLHFVMNDARLFELVEKITGCGPVGCFHGRIYCMKAGEGHHHKWHTDFSHHRILGVSINLTRGAFKGGEFQLRDARTHKQLLQIHNSGFGDVIIFRLSADLEHRVADMKGTRDKLAFAGWFSSKPDYWASVRRRFVKKQKSRRRIPAAAS